MQLVAKDASNVAGFVVVWCLGSIQSSNALQLVAKRFAHYKKGCIVRGAKHTTYMKLTAFNNDGRVQIYNEDERIALIHKDGTKEHERTLSIEEEEAVSKLNYGDVKIVIDPLGDYELVNGEVVEKF